jgi:hypothetical protein
MNTRPFTLLDVSLALGTRCGIVLMLRGVPVANIIYTPHGIVYAAARNHEAWRQLPTIRRLAAEATGQGDDDGLDWLVQAARIGDTLDYAMMIIDCMFTEEN